MATKILIIPPVRVPNSSTLENSFQYRKLLGIFSGCASRSAITGPQGIFLGTYQPEIPAYLHKRHILEFFKIIFHITVILSSQIWQLHTQPSMGRMDP